MLVQEGYAFPEAIETAQFGMKSLNQNTVRLASKLFQDLIKLGQGVREAIAAAQVVLQNPNIRYFARELLDLAQEKQAEMKAQPISNRR
jgi:hypothetical protein